MPLSDLGAVPEHLGNNWGGNLSNEVTYRRVSRPEQVDPESSESDHQGVGVYVFAGAVAREQPRTFPARGAEIWAIRDVLT